MSFHRYDQLCCYKCSGLVGSYLLICLVFRFPESTTAVVSLAGHPIPRGLQSIRRPCAADARDFPYLLLFLLKCDKRCSLLLEAKVSQVWVGGSCRWSAANEARNSDTCTSRSLLAESGMPGKNGPPKRQQTNGQSSSTGDGRRCREGGQNPWLTGGGLSRVGRCKCCS